MSPVLLRILGSNNSKTIPGDNPQCNNYDPNNFVYFHHSDKPVYKPDVNKTTGYHLILHTGLPYDIVLPVLV